MWGADPDESVAFSEQGYSNQQEISSYEGTDFSIAFDKGTNNNAPKYYNTGSAIRAYGGNTIMVSSTTKNISKIVMTFSSGENNNAISADQGTYSNGTWEGDASSVTFTIGGSSGHRRIASIAVTYKAASKTLSSIAITTAPNTLNYLEGETFSKTGAVVTATYDDASSAAVTASATWDKTTLSTSDTKVTASYTEGDVTKTANQDIHVYSVTVLKQDETGATITADGVSASASGRTLTANATTASKYVFKGWKYATGGEGGTAISGNSLTGIPTGNVTVIAEFYKPITVTWIVNQGDWNDKGGTTKVAYNTSWSALDLPTAPVPNENGCGHKFMGWTTTANYSNATTAPSDLLNSANQSSKTGVKVTNNVIFYAVFADYDDND